MSRVYETHHQPAKDYQVCVRRKCDLCGAEAKGDDWKAGIYEINETEVSVTVKAKQGSNYPEGGSGTEYEVDLCPKCFANELVPWLLSRGARIEKKEWDW